MNNKRFTAALIAATLALACSQALAQETTPLAARVQEESAQAEQLRPFTSKRSYNGVEASSKWLYQARLGNSMLNMRMFTADGEQLTFQEKLGAAEGAEGIRLVLRAGARGETMLLQLDQSAVDTLGRLGITQIVVTDIDMYVQASYLTQDLAALRSMFSVGEKELLCVSGEDDPVTVVSVDGVRRQITQ